MGAATMKSDGERMRSAVTALQLAQKRLVPMDDVPIQELWNIRQLLREQRHEEAVQRLTRNNGSGLRSSEIWGRQHRAALKK